MTEKPIYLILQGRIGNQLFQYAFARHLQIQSSFRREIIIDDSRVLDLEWENSLEHYSLPDVRYTHDDITVGNMLLWKHSLIRTFYKLLTRHAGYMKRYSVEQKFSRFSNRFGVFICENGFLDDNLNLNKVILLDGFFQSEEYFYDNRANIKQLLSGNQFIELDSYSGISEIRKRNSVCISVKVEHNVGSSLYDVCDISYWKNAISIITESIENPLFFICSDNVPYVLDNLIDASRFDYVVQDSQAPVHISLAAMAECKHFIIGNTTFGWWAQYLSTNDEKIVVAPSRWMAIDMPIDIYQSGWILVTT